MSRFRIDPMTHLEGFSSFVIEANNHEEAKKKANEKVEGNYWIVKLED